MIDTFVRMSLISYRASALTFVMLVTLSLFVDAHFENKH